MADIILHHYGLSTFAAKARMMLNWKGIAWRSVDVPMVMPKPDMVALTGGWRMVPVLQIGADIYVDSKCVAAQIDRLRPDPALYPGRDVASTWGLSAWIESVFLDIVTVSFCDGMLPPEFLADRVPSMPEGFFDLERARASLPSRLDRLRAACLRLDAQLGDGRAYLLGDAPSLADFSAWAPLGSAPLVPGAAPALAGCDHLLAWHARMAPLDKRPLDPMTGAEAVEIARAATPETQPDVSPDDANGYRVGDRIRFSHAAYCSEVIEGELVRADAFTMAIRRHDPRAGEVVVHFPREGTAVTRL
ncbi:MAG: glutathione S-transferase family protein [Sphingobium sp.]